MFIFDPSTRAIVYNNEKFTRSYTSAIWKDAHMVVGDDGYVYGTISNIYNNTTRYSFFKIDPGTKALTVLRATNSRLIAKDNYGNIYFMGDESNLYRYEK